MEKFRSNLQAKPVASKRVAILPVTVLLTGRLPKGYTPERQMAEEESQSVAIQQIVYSQYLRHSPKNKKGNAVTFIDPVQVNSRLRENGISIRDSWQKNPDSLGKIVGADLVLVVNVKSKRIMSESAAIGVDIASHVIDRLLSDKNAPSTNEPFVRAKTYTLYVSAALTSVADHTMINRYEREASANWHRSPENVLQKTGKKIVKKGPLYASN